MDKQQIISALQQQRQQIDLAIEALNGTRKRGRRFLSAAAKARISQAMKKRWAAKRKAK
jgi:hypothetical protein